MNFKRILSLFLCLIMLATCALPLASCGGGKKCSHADDNADKICDKCGEAVTIEKCAQCTDANSNGKCDICGTSMSTAAPGKTNYVINVKTLGGMPMEGVSVYVYNQDGLIATLPMATDENGNVTFELDTKTGYTIHLDGVPKGYDVKTGDTAENRYQMGPTGAQIILNSKPVTEGSLENNYLLGDVMYDFEIKDINGNVYKLSELLKTKKMVMLNFWYTDCSWCNKEFPDLNASYKKFTDSIEILAINDYATDSEAEVKDFPTTGYYEGADDNLVFPFFKVGNTAGDITIGKFGGFGEGNTGYPTSVIIDRYGVICMIEQGAITGVSKWDKIFNYFTAENYQQKLIHDSKDLTPLEKPNIAWGGSEGIAANLNGSADLLVQYSPDTNEYSWPFIPVTKDGVTAVKSTNTEDGTYAILYAEIQLKPGQAVMVDYFSSCEYGSDRIAVIVNNENICSLTGVNIGSFSNLSDWEQCCTYVDPRPVTLENKDTLATYKIAFTYLKDDSGSDGDDTVYLRNLRVIDANDIPVETYIIRDAVSDPTSDGSGFNTYVKYELGEDGYYHVVNADGSEGPLLLANFLSYTNFDPNNYMSKRIMDAGKILVNNVDKYNIWMIYATATANSAIYGYTPVTAELKEILVAYCDQYKYTDGIGKDSHPDLWLQLCIYYDAYGKDKDGNPVKQMEDPIKGLTSFSAFETEFKENPVKGDKVEYSVTYDRVIMPRGFLYRFSPKTSGVYRITSHSDQEVNGWIFTGSSYEWVLSEGGERDVLANFEEEERYCPALNVPNEGGNGFYRDNNNLSLVAYMEAGKEYFIDIAYYDMYAEGTFTFDITYEGAEMDVFVMASPGPVTFIETAEGGMGQYIALGIDYAVKVDPADGIKYVYQVLERDENDVPTKWGEKLYADFYYPTIPFPRQSFQELVNIGAFDFSLSELDRDAKVFLKTIRDTGKTYITAKWTNEGIENANELWNTKNLDSLLELIQSGADVSAFPADDVATATEAVKHGEFLLKKEWGIENVGSADWEKYSMDSVLLGTLSTDETIKAAQQEILAGINKLWNESYQLDDVAKGIYHGDGKDETETIRKYITLMEDDTNYPERQGCVAVTEELSIILSQLFSKYIFEDTQNDFLKFCFYYKHLGA